MARAQKPDFVFRRNGRVHLNRRGRQFTRLLTAEVCASAVVMLDTPCSEVVWRVLATHSIHQFPLHFPSRASPCAITFQLDSNIMTDARICILGKKCYCLCFGKTSICSFVEMQQESLVIVDIPFRGNPALDCSTFATIRWMGGWGGAQTEIIECRTDTPKRRYIS